VAVTASVKAPWRAQPIAAEQGQHHPAARQLVAQALLPALPGADVVLVVEQGPSRPFAPDALADRRCELVVVAAMADEDVGHRSPSGRYKIRFRTGLMLGRALVA
jgi:hypothetical protein